MPVIDIRHGDLFEVLAGLPADSVDAVATDPPYGIGYQGREWDTFRPGVEAAREVANKLADSDNPNLRGRKRAPASSPSAVEYDYTLTGLRGFQKFSEDWGRAVYRVMKPGAYLLATCAPRSFHRMACGLEDAGFVVRHGLVWLYGKGYPKSIWLDEPQTVGTALKPGHEPIALCWKPPAGTIRDCYAEHGTAGLNLRACGSELADGRWPADVLLDEDAADTLDVQAGGAPPESWGGTGIDDWNGDRTGVSRFFYVAKPSTSERNRGCWDLPTRTGGEATGRQDGTAGVANARAGAGRTGNARNTHPTVKPIGLMRWMVRLITPPGGLVLDPFNGSGTTGIACAYEGRRYLGIEREAEYVEFSRRRIGSAFPLLVAADEAAEVRA